MVETARYASLGLEMGLAVAVGWAIGHWLDGYFGTAPWLMLLFVLFGVAAGFKGLISAAQRASKLDSEPAAASLDEKPDDDHADS